MCIKNIQGEESYLRFCAHKKHLRGRKLLVFASLCFLVAQNIFVKKIKKLEITLIPSITYTTQNIIEWP